MRTLLHLIVAAIALSITAWLLQPLGVVIESFWVALVAAVVLALINAFLKPVLQVLTLPINILTLGLFSIILNALLILLVDALVPGFAVNGFWNALLFSIVLWLVNSVFGMLKD